MAYSGSLCQALENKDLNGIQFCFQRATPGTQTGNYGTRKVVKYGHEVVGLDYVIETVNKIYSEQSSLLNGLAKTRLEDIKKSTTLFEKQLSHITLEEPSYLTLVTRVIQDLFIYLKESLLILLSQVRS